ncbi:MAG: prepilin-type N-terminal cleavage/methylation domain-containing protein [Deltaproteobacteria bacterium]
MNAWRTHRRRGFTLIEVMIAIGIMTVGSLGILSMHHAVSGANRSAHEMNTALAITERWIERVDRDSLSWSEPGINSSTLTGTTYLAPLAATTTGTNWFTPAPALSTESYGFDYFGNDTSTASEIKYCTNLRLSWIRQGSSARVDIRTFWYRAGHMPGTATHPDWVSGSNFRGADCDAATADGWGIGTAPNVDAVFASTVVQWLRRD